MIDVREVAIEIFRSFGSVVIIDLNSYGGLLLCFDIQALWWLLRTLYLCIKFSMISKHLQYLFTLSFPVSKFWGRLIWNSRFLRYILLKFPSYIITFFFNDCFKFLGLDHCHYRESVRMIFVPPPLKFLTFEMFMASGIHRVGVNTWGVNLVLRAPIWRHLYHNFFLVSCVVYAQMLCRWSLLYYTLNWFNIIKVSSFLFLCHL